MTTAPRSEFVHVTYIRTTAERLWSALTEDTEFMKQCWFGTRCEMQVVLLCRRSSQRQPRRRAVRSGTAWRPQALCAADDEDV